MSYPCTWGSHSPTLLVTILYSILPFRKKINRPITLGDRKRESLSCLMSTRTVWNSTKGRRIQDLPYFDPYHIPQTMSPIIKIIKLLTTPSSGDTVLNGVACCDPYLPSKEIKLLLFPPKPCLCIFTRHLTQRTKILATGARHCSRYLVWINSFVPHSTPTREGLPWFYFYRGGCWSAQRASHFAKRWG